MGLLNDASGWLAGMMRAAASPDGTITYVRGATRIDLTGRAWAAAGRSLRNPGETGPAVQWGQRDYLIPAAALPDGFEPAKGDRVEEAVNGTVVKFDVAPGAAGEPAARWSDDERTVWRVHTKQAKGT